MNRPNVPPEGPIDIDALTKSIRAEIDRRRDDAPLSDTTPNRPTPLAAVPELDTARMLMEQAHRVANTGTTLPAFGVLGPVRRRLARFVTRILYALLRVITVDQSVFNKLVLDMLANVSNGVRRGDAALVSALKNLERSAKDGDARLRDALAQQQAAAQSALAVRDQQLEQLGQLESAARQRVTELDQRLDQQLKQIADALESVRANTQAQSRRVAMLAEGVTQDASDASAERVRTPPALSMVDSQFDALYVAFEDAFRGTPEEIAERQRTYLPTLQQAHLGTEDSPILDVGCGRGEWLEVLRQAGLAARGIDLNPILVDRCQRAGLDVVRGDAVAYLRELPTGSLGAVTAFQVIEHLPFEVFLDFLHQAVRVLRSGGVVIFETPNPENVIVGSCSFYYDPSHQRPLPPTLAKFFLEMKGLHDVSIVYLNPPDDQRIRPEDTELTRRFNHYFHGPRDYAVIGWKP
jgi:O-antigen chain-terminating methyltransferase